MADQQENNVFPESTAEPTVDEVPASTEPLEEPSPEAEPTKDPTPEPEAAKDPTPEPEVTKDPTPPEPEAAKDPTPEPEITKDPTPPEPEVTKDPTPPEPEAANDPTPEPEAAKDPTPEPEPAKEPTLEPQPPKNPAIETEEVIQPPAAEVTLATIEVTVGEEEVKEKPKPSVTIRTKIRTTNPADGVDIAMGEEGIASDDPLTIPEVFKISVERYGERNALGYKEGDEWKFINYKEYYQLVVSAAKSFIKLGLEDFRGVGILGFNSKEYVIANLGAIFAGGLAFGIYATSNADACQYIAQNCQANILVVENQKQLDKILQFRDQLPNLKAIVQYTGKLSQEYENTYDWEQFMELGKDIENSVIEDKIAAMKPNQCATLVYTSGTTGNPKGVMLSHDNVLWAAKSLKIHTLPNSDEQHVVVSYLPLSHIAAQVSDIYLAVYFGGKVCFAQPDALKGSLVVTLREAQPTLFFGVPRVWEKFAAAIQNAGAQTTGIKKALGSWARGKSLRGFKNIQKNESVPWGWTIASKLLKRVREVLGLQHCQVMLTGAAPIHIDVLEFFMSVGLPILEVYGMSENSGPHTCNIIGKWKPGSVGVTCPGCKTKIDNPDADGEGEICMSGRHVFMGYLNNEEKTKSTIDDEGWLHTGDIGKVDEEGFLSITGRIKELIITSGGENMAPVPVEDRIKQAAPFLSNVVMIGDKRKFVSCLATLKCVMDPDSGEPTDDLDVSAIKIISGLGSKCTKVSEVIEQKDEVVFAAIQQALTKANEKAVSNAQKVQKFTLLDRDFSIPGGELGPTLKLKRHVVTKKYVEQIDLMYE